MSLIILPPTPVPMLKIGDFYQGGYYAGRFSNRGKTYDLVVAPKALGQFSAFFGMAYWAGGEGNPQYGIATGLENTTVYADGEHPAADLAVTKNINGFADWYIPSRNELEMLFRVFRPVPSAVSPNNLDTTGYYPNEEDYEFAGSDTSRVLPGNNWSTLGDGLPYTASQPDQTQFDLFKIGGAESFYDLTLPDPITDNVYWSSTANDSDGSTPWVFTQDFYTGRQESFNGDYIERPTRLVRRIEVVA